MEILKVHYTPPRKAAYLDFTKSPGKVDHSDSALLMKYVYKKTHESQTVYSVKYSRRKPRFHSLRFTRISLKKFPLPSYRVTSNGYITSYLAT